MNEDIVIAINGLTAAVRSVSMNVQGLLIVLTLMALFKSMGGK